MFIFRIGWRAMWRSAKQSGRALRWSTRWAERRTCNATEIGNQSLKLFFIYFFRTIAYLVIPATIVVITWVIKLAESDPPFFIIKFIIQLWMMRNLNKIRTGCCSPPAFISAPPSGAFADPVCTPPNKFCKNNPGCKGASSSFSSWATENIWKIIY